MYAGAYGTLRRASVGQIRIRKPRQGSVEELLINEVSDEALEEAGDGARVRITFDDWRELRPGALRHPPKLLSAR